MKTLEIKIENQKPVVVTEENLKDCEFIHKEKIFEKLKNFAKEVGETDGIIYVEIEENEIKNIWFNHNMHKSAHIELQKALDFIN